MNENAGETSLSLPEYLAARARGASDTRLVVDAGGGLLATVGILWLRPWAWIILAAAAACFASYGLWGILDRELRERRAVARPGLVMALRTFRAAAALLGAAAALTLIFGTAGLVLGRIIS